MQRKLKKYIFIVLLLPILFTFSASVQANERYVVILPACLKNGLEVSYKTLSSSNTLSLIEVNERAIEKLIELKQQNRARHCGGFIDVTESWKSFQLENPGIRSNATAFLNSYKTTNKKNHKKSSYSIKYENKINPLLEQLSTEKMINNLTTLTNFTDRDAKSPNGLKAAQWIKEQIELLAKQYNRHDITAYMLDTGGKYIQPSVVVRLGNSPEPGIIIGAHMDTVSAKKENKPGADDDGSGVVTLFEVARILFANEMHFKKPIYFIWYAAEEPGNRGSEQVVADFLRQNISVEAVLQLDMTGYENQADPTIWLLDDYVDSELNSYIETLVKTYVKQPVKYTSCGYGCSDHASWFIKGIPAVSPFEAEVGKENPYVHTARDTMDILSWDHILDFAKLTMAFTVELAEPFD
ncbi:leucine aminopeptidase [Legionella steigerwaltii]|uniref:Leucine aminopeptidase n=1 Tax=Legionella steigerwaltii TaxID=460 RepID=A0A378LA46_9GAMM|nr:M20/M25/M40 family metallo-hydrolase [Legionella steigerwaltii]KTD81111.1 leucine aminopeptidase [Legionella steigerwaltii]STY23200.1 leucine aminopeptidase [Legionella steigerwaltii]